MDLSLFSQATSSLSAAVTLAKSFVGLRDEAQRLAATNELLAEINEAHSKISALLIAHADRAAEHQAALREKRDLEEELRRVKAEKADLENYALHELSPGVFVYARRPGVESTEPMHYLCAPCRNDGKKSILQRSENYGAVFHRCPQCDTNFLERHKPQPVVAPVASPWRDW
jgi:hypothetical protein